RALLAPPPPAAERLARAAGAVERVQLGHVLGRELEVEELAVLGDPLAVRRLRNHRDVPLDGPAKQDLGGRSSEAPSDSRCRVAAEVAAAAERAVRLEDDVSALARVEQPFAELVGAELDLIDDRCGGRRCQQLVDLGRAEVRDADRPHVPELPSALHPGPRPGRAVARPVDDVEVHVVDAEPLETPLGLGGRVAPPGMELRRQEDLLARDAALAQPLSDALLVAVRLRGVDVAVTELQRPADRIDALTPIAGLPDPQAEQWDLGAVREDPCPAVRRYCRRAHPSLVLSPYS